MRASAGAGSTWSATCSLSTPAWARAGAWPARACCGLGVGERRVGRLEAARRQQRGAQLDEGVDVLGRAGRLHRGCLSEERDRRGYGAARDRRLGRRDEVCGGAPPELGAQRGVVSELAGVAPRLAEVVAEHRVRADGVLLEPVGEAHVQPRPTLLRDGLVGGAVQEHVAEAEGVATGELGARRARRSPCA